MVQQQRFRVEELAGVGGAHLERGAVLPISRLVHAEAASIERTVHRYLTDRDLFTRAGHADGAAKVQCLALVVKARDYVIDDHQHLLPLAARAEERPTLALAQPELELLPSELRQERAQYQQQQGQVRDKRGKLRPAETIREKVHRSVATLGLHAEPVPAQHRRQRARVRRRGKIDAVPGALKIGIGYPPLRAAHKAIDRREPADGANRDRQSQQRDERVPVRLTEEIKYPAVGVVEPGKLGERVGEGAPRAALLVDELVDRNPLARQLGRDLGNDDASEREECHDADQFQREPHRGEFAPDPIDGIRIVLASASARGARWDHLPGATPLRPR